MNALRGGPALPVDRLLTRLLVVTACLFAAMYAWVALRRMGYPYELEWMEGGMVDHVSRVLDGKPLYVEPSLDFVPFMYPPLYFQACALMARITGPGFLALRLVSFLASLGCLAAIMRFVQRETASRSAGLIAAGLYAATFTSSGSFFDIGRVDSLFLCLVLWGGYVARFHPRLRGGVVAGVLLSLAFLCKQAAPVVAGPIVLGAFLMNARRGSILGGVFVVLSGVVTWLLISANEPWYGFYIFQLPREHAVLFRYLVHFWTLDVFVVLIPFGAGLLYLLARLRSSVRSHTEDRGPACFLALLCGGLLLASWVIRLYSGSYLNVLMPMHAAVALAAGCALGSLQMRSPRSRQSRVLQIALLVGLLLQFGMLRYDPRGQVPSPESRAACAQLLDRIRSIEGRVIVPFHGHLAAMAGQPPFPHQLAVHDVKPPDSPAADALKQAVEEGLRSQDYAAIILDAPGWHRETLEEFYEYVGPSIENIEELLPMTGAPSVPWRLYLPRK